MKTNMIHPWKLSLFVLLSVADLLLTLHLLRVGEGFIYESNPIARWWLDGFGRPGLAGFKLAMVLFIGGLAVVISRYRPRTGSFLLTFACSATALVVLYSAALGEVLSGRIDLDAILGKPEIPYVHGLYPGWERGLVPRLMGDLSSEEDDVRQGAASCLGAMGADAAPAVPVLMQNVLRLPEERTGVEQEALAKIGPPAVQYLRLMRDSDSDRARRKAAELLERIERAEAAR